MCSRRAGCWGPSPSRTDPTTRCLGGLWRLPENTPTVGPLRSRAISSCGESRSRPRTHVSSSLDATDRFGICARRLARLTLVASARCPPPRQTRRAGGVHTPQRPEWGRDAWGMDVRACAPLVTGWRRQPHEGNVNMWSLLWCIERHEGDDVFPSPDFGGFPARRVSPSWDARRSVSATLAAFAAFGPVSSAALAQAPPPPGSESSTIPLDQLDSDPSDVGDDTPDPTPSPAAPAAPPPTPPVVVVTPDAGEFDPDAPPTPPAPPAPPAAPPSPAPPAPPVEPVPPAPPVVPVEPPTAPPPPVPPPPPPAPPTPPVAPPPPPPVPPTTSGAPVPAAAPTSSPPVRRAAPSRRGTSGSPRPRASTAPRRMRFTSRATTTRRFVRPAPAAATVVSSWSAEAPRATTQTHVVRRGESLWQIASQQAGPGASNTAVAAIVSHLWTVNAPAMGTGDPNVLRVGTTLRMPEVRRA